MLWVLVVALTLLCSWLRRHKLACYGCFGLPCECKAFEIMLWARPSTLEIATPNLALRYQTCRLCSNEEVLTEGVCSFRSPASILITIFGEGRLRAREEDPPLLARGTGRGQPRPNSALQYGAMAS
jgi:hypothetical protein